MKIVFIVSSILCIIPTIFKGITHVLLDIRNSHRVDFARSKGYIYFFPYDKEVSEKDEKLKRVCNYFQKLSILFLIVFIMTFLIRLIVGQ